MVRFKKRYILAEISFRDGLIDESLSKYAIQDAIKETVKKVHGDYGLACILMSLRLKYLNPFTNVVFIACSRDHYKLLQSSLTFIKSLKDRACVFKTLHIGGTIRSCQRFLVQHNKVQLHHMLDQCKTPAEREKVSTVIDKATTEATALDPVCTWKRRTKALTKVHKKDDTDDSDSSAD